jgi:ATP-dependent Clp protease adaptor protein ClpS
LPIVEKSFGILTCDALRNTAMTQPLFFKASTGVQDRAVRLRRGFPARAAGNDDNAKGPGDGRTTTGVVVKPRPKVKKPSMYKVLMLNDDYTPMEFVVHVLERFFAKSTEEATRIMLHVHQKGVGVCGVYTFEVAETKVNQTMELARKNQHPLQCTLEKE